MQEFSLKRYLPPPPTKKDARSGGGLDCRKNSAKCHSLMPPAKRKNFHYGARSREPTIIRRTNIYHLHQRKKTPEGVISLVEVVGVEPTSYSATRELSTYLFYLLFLNLATRVNTLCKTQKAKFSYKNAFRFLQECSVLLTPRPVPTDKYGVTTVL